MKKRLGIIAVAVIFAAAAVILILWGTGAKNDGEASDTAAPGFTAAPFPVAVPAPTGIPAQSASPSPDPTSEPSPVFISAKLAFAGDIVMHPGLSTYALKDGKYDYSFLFGDVAEYLSAADYAAATLRGTFPGETTYTGYPLIKAPDAMAKGIRETGIDLVSVATKNSFDSLLPGLVRTLDVAEAAGLLPVGSNRSPEEADKKRGMRIVDVNGINIAYIAYTCVTGEQDYSSCPYAVNLICDSSTGAFDYERMEKDLDFAHEAGADLIVVLIQWGNEYYTTAVKYQIDISDFLLVRGADIIIGGHPYVPQPMETRRVTDKYGRSKTGLICYSLGNMVSCLTDEYTNLSAIVNVAVEKNISTGETYIADMSYIPLFMTDYGAFGITGTEGRYKLSDLHAATDAYESGSDAGFINNKLYEAMLKALSDIHGFFGEEADAAERDR